LLYPAELRKHGFIISERDSPYNNFAY